LAVVLALAPAVVLALAPAVAPAVALALVPALALGETPIAVSWVNSMRFPAASGIQRASFDRCIF
jgi:hypothetical protein